MNRRNFLTGSLAATSLVGAGCATCKDDDDDHEEHGGSQAGSTHGKGTP